MTGNKQEKEFLDYLDGDRELLEDLRKKHPELGLEIKELMVAEDEIKKSLNANNFPRQSIRGLAGEFADLYSNYLESPWTFFAFNFLT